MRSFLIALTRQHNLVLIARYLVRQNTRFGLLAPLFLDLQVAWIDDLREDHACVGCGLVFFDVARRGRQARLDRPVVERSVPIRDRLGLLELRAVLQWL